jgi:hypothetical protein
VSGWVAFNRIKMAFGPLTIAVADCSLPNAAIPLWLNHPLHHLCHTPNSFASLAQTSLKWAPNNCTKFPNPFLVMSTPFCGRLFPITKIRAFLLILGFTGKCHFVHYYWMTHWPKYWIFSGGELIENIKFCDGWEKNSRNLRKEKKADQIRKIKSHGKVIFLNTF